MDKVDAMPKFSQRSEDHLNTCHPDLIRICRFVIQTYDFTVLCGHRGQEEQDAAYPTYTRVRWPDSKHNQTPSLAVDIIPYDPVRRHIVPWDEYESFALLAGHMLMAAYAFAIPIRWGGNWTGGYNHKENSFRDYPHYELTSNMLSVS
jgi:peptidoglycan L-alanyl-D-glutamate endopeptidase CwlK